MPEHFYRLENIHIATGDTVAFKTIHGKWYTGIIHIIVGGHFEIEVTLPIEPNYYSPKDIQIYYPMDVVKVVVLEGVRV